MKQKLFKVYIKDTDIVSVSLLQTLNNVRSRHMFKILKYSIYKKISNRVIKARLIKVKSIENEEIMMRLTKIITVIMKITIIMMIVKIKTSNQMKI